MTSTKQIVTWVANQYGYARDQLLSHDKSRRKSRARQVCMLILRDRCELTLREIATALRRKDAKNILYGINYRATRLRSVDRKIIQRCPIKNPERVSA